MGRQAYMAGVISLLFFALELKNQILRMTSEENYIAPSNYFVIEDILGIKDVYSG